MRYIWILFVISFAALSHAAEPSADMDEFIQSEMKTAKSPGLAYAVVQDEYVEVYAYGEALKGSGRNVTPDTPFTIGSISKSFTALGIMKLVESGEVELDAPVAQYLDAFKDRPSGAITIRQLLSHTSGYSTLQGNDTEIDRRQSTDALQRQVHRIAQWSPAYAPGTRWAYSNANYLIAGALIETVSGQEFATFIESEILKPVGMSRSFVADGGGYAELAQGHQP